MERWKLELEALLEAQDHSGLLRFSRRAPASTLRYLSGRLPSHDADTKWRAVRALGALVSDPALLSDERLTELLRRYFWSLNDESGAVPFGVPEAIGEILACRPSLQKDFLPLICSMTHEEEVIQTGAIERGVVWAIGRIGEPARLCDPEVLRIRSLAAHPDPETRQIAEWALRRLEGARE